MNRYLPIPDRTIQAKKDTKKSIVTVPVNILFLKIVTIYLEVAETMSRCSQVSSIKQKQRTNLMQQK